MFLLCVKIHPLGTIEDCRDTQIMVQNITIADTLIDSQFWCMLIVSLQKAEQCSNIFLCLWKLVGGIAWYLGRNGKLRAAVLFSKDLL